MDFINSIVDFFIEMVNVLLNIISTINTTTDMIDSVDFKQSTITTYLGYIKYIVGPLLFTALWTFCVIPVGIMLWQVAMKSYVLIRQLIG